jgi:mannose-6-phosphate isomerase
VARAEPGSRLFVGLKPGVERERFERALAEGTAEGWVQAVPVAAGDSILIRSGQVHAIDAGNLILEIQQNSDTTYRLYDWGRTGLDGRPRQLHLAESLRSMHWDEPAPLIVRAAAESGMLATCPEFSIRRVVLRPGAALAIQSGRQPRLVSVIEGALQGSIGLLGPGENALVPYAVDAAFTAVAPTTALVTEDFT